MDSNELDHALAQAVNAGDVSRTRTLLDAGANVRYVRPHGYTVLIDAMHGRDIAADPQLLALLRLLIDRGADLNAVSSYGESAIRVASHHGRFDAVRLLLDAGADRTHLGWLELHHAVALGTTQDIQTCLSMHPDLDARDCWDRTPWLLSVQRGNVAGTEMLLEAGADPAARGRCGQTTLMFAVESRNPEMLRWLLSWGADPNEVDDFQRSPLIVAAEVGNTIAVRLLLAAGADVHQESKYDSPIKAASSLEVARMLVAAGADLNSISAELRAALTKLPNDGVPRVSKADYVSGKRRRYGCANPELMKIPFWADMIRSGLNAAQARQRFGDSLHDDKPVWCFQRFGKSLTELPDGRIIEIAGEHEDYYDPDFCIYNDVIVHHGDGTFDLYGYPESVFPPTDFHTATLVGDTIYIIGNVGYMGTRAFGTTPVYRLSVSTLAIKRVETTGDAPGWIGNHKARVVDNTIEIWGGKVCGWRNGKETYEDNGGGFILDLHTLAWTRRSG